MQIRLIGIAWIRPARRNRINTQIVLKHEYEYESRINAVVKKGNFASDAFAWERPQPRLPSDNTSVGEPVRVYSLEAWPAEELFAGDRRRFLLLVALLITFSRHLDCIKSFARVSKNTHARTHKHAPPARSGGYRGYKKTENLPTGFIPLPTTFSI